MIRRHFLLLGIMVVLLTSEVSTLFFMRPHNLTFIAVLSIVFLFVSGVVLFDFTYQRVLKTMAGVVVYGFTSVVSLVLSEAITLMYVSYLYPGSFHHDSYTSTKALGNALILFTGYGYPYVTGWAHGVIVFLMLYSWLINVLLISKLITILQTKIRI